MVVDEVKRFTEVLESFILLSTKKPFICLEKTLTLKVIVCLEN